MLGLDTLVMVYGGLLYGGFSCVGRYGEGGLALAAITLVEFCALGAVVLAGGEPGLAATAMFASRLLGTAGMFLWMRHRAPWLHFGKPVSTYRELKRLFSPALASGAFPAGLALNVQGMIILVGVVTSPASAAIFSTLRTMSRAVIQLMASILTVIAPEISRAFAQNDVDLLRTIHRRGCQAAVWLATPILVILALFGGQMVQVWTSGTVNTSGLLLYLFLAVAAINSLWYTSMAVLFATNRHQRAAVHYVLASAAVLPVAYLLIRAWDLDGAALSLVLLELYMLFVVLRQALPAAHDTVRAWLGALVTPPSFLLSSWGLRFGTRGS
jgi:O-antigen/teichoic acid export membrane protein